ncbi:BMP family protein [Actinotalea sp. Marseille-Q4924]|uniref:BMP family lipoprotein n=1 Tax=Actinotalea sp. Marseille-Q4924 TaxID=2866571 RepID=UPI001CE4200C|nr:BMP family ABC transporter substrate-binding protein [Actinotalea sp. Marseille-Q4924]
MKQRMTGAVVAAAALLALTACGGTAEAPADDDATAGGGGEGGEATNVSVAHVVAGALGDQGFFDDAERGIQGLTDAGSETTTIQADANNPAQWKSNLESVSNGDWGVVVTGTSQILDILAETAPKYPDQDYIYYDDVVEAPNVASITYKQNEGAFLAGVLAAQATSNPDAFPRSEGSKVVGLVGGMDIPVINDFVEGFRSGVEAVDPSIEVVVSYVGDFEDSNKGYDQARAMYEQEGADVVFQVAGAAGLGVFQAAEDTDNYAIGVDSNQNSFNEGFILASMLKNIGASIESAVAEYEAGTLEMGSVTSYGLANDGVSLTFEDNGDIVPQEIQDEISTYAQQVIDGEVEVGTAY